MEVLCDTKEPDKYYKFLRKVFPDLTFVQTHLRDGDYATNKLLVERKTIGDLHTSIVGYRGHKGRFPTQVERLSTHGDQHVVVMITGDVKTYVDAMKAIGVMVDTNVIYGELASIHCRYKIPPFHIEDEWQAFIHMVKLMKKFDEGKEDVPARRNVEILQAKMLGISINQWSDLRRRYHSLVGVGNADLKGIMQTRGIGPSKAQIILNVLHGREY
jgi:ERCC4-type nuclease